MLSIPQKILPHHRAILLGNNDLGGGAWHARHPTPHCNGVNAVGGEGAVGSTLYSTCLTTFTPAIEFTDSAEDIDAFYAEVDKKLNDNERRILQKRDAWASRLRDQED
jgi:hypothetical protein